MLTSHPRSLPDLLAGRYVVPGDADWDVVRQAFNLTLDLQPTAVALPRDVLEVSAVVRYAAERGLRVAPQATAHNPGPLGSLEDTILLDVRSLQHVSIDAERLRVRVEGAQALNGREPMVRPEAQQQVPGYPSYPRPDVRRASRVSRSRSVA